MISCLHHATLVNLGALLYYLKYHARKLDKAMFLCVGHLLTNDTTSLRYVSNSISALLRLKPKVRVSRHRSCKHQLPSQALLPPSALHRLLCQTPTSLCMCFLTLCTLYRLRLPLELVLACKQVARRRTELTQELIRASKYG